MAAKSYGISMQEALWDRLKRWAKKGGRNLSGSVAILVQDFLDAEEKKEKKKK